MQWLVCVSGHVKRHLLCVLLYNVLSGQQLVDRRRTRTQLHCDWSDQIHGDFQEALEWFFTRLWILKLYLTFMSLNTPNNLDLI